MMPDPRHHGRETECGLGLEQVSPGASSNAPSSLPY